MTNVIFSLTMIKKKVFNLKLKIQKKKKKNKKKVKKKGKKQ